MTPIKTLGKDGKQNGVLIPLWHVDTGPRIDQVYLTTVMPWSMKGPHLHKVRRGLFCCVRGEAIAVVRLGGEYKTFSLKPGDPALEIPPGVPVALYNPSGIEALVLNMPSPPWRVGEEDEWPVEDWDFHL